MKKAVEAGDHGLARKLIGIYLNHRSAKLSALNVANRSLRPGWRVPADWVSASVDWVDPFRPTLDEPVLVNARPKKGGYRAVCEFGLERKAKQILVRRALEPFAAACILDCQYGALPGRGRNRCIADIIAALSPSANGLPSPYRFAATLDVRNHYGSVDHRRLPDFMAKMLPRLVTEHVLTNTHARADLRRAYPPFSGNDPGERSALDAPGYTPEPDADTQADAPDNTESQTGSRVSRSVYHQTPPPSLGDAGIGLPQGSAASPLVAEIVTASVLRSATLPSGVRLFVYADNLLVLGRTRAEVEAAAVDLRFAFERADAGNMELRTERVARVADGFEFLGYGIKRRREQVSVAPTRKNVVELHISLLADAARLAVGRASQSELRRRVEGWRRGFSQCDTRALVLCALKRPMRLLQPYPSAWPVWRELCREVVLAER